jgi:hypothetical protein
MEILHYTIDLKSLFEAQDSQLEMNTQKEIEKKRQGEENKKKLLKHVLPLMHGIFELHNRRCHLDNSSTTGKKGLLGLNKVDTQKELDYIANGDYWWKDNFATFEYRSSNIEFKVWLNKSNKMVITPNLGYSMTEVIRTGAIYGEGVESELLKVAQKCAEYQDQW